MRELDIADQLLADGYITPAERELCSEFHDDTFPVTMYDNGDVVIHREPPVTLRGYAEPAGEPPVNMAATNIHYHYDKLTDAERAAVDEAYGELTAALGEHGVGIRGDDTAERVIDAIACGVLNSLGLIRRPVATPMTGATGETPGWRRRYRRPDSTAY